MDKPIDNPAHHRHGGFLHEQALPRAAAAIAHWRERLTAFRIPLMIGAVLLFLGGAVLSFERLGISPTSLEPRALAALAFLVIPSLIYGGIGLTLLARSCGVSIPVGKATTLSAYAYLAELLPLPGGAIVRTGALMNAGGGLRRSSALVLLTAILWISLAMFGAGLTLFVTGLNFALPLLVTGTVIATAIYVWLWRTASPAIATQTLAHRALGIFLTALRLQFAFAVLHTTIGFLDAMPFTFAMLLGSASSIAPAGLGVSETLAALAATTSAYPPETAFLAVGIDRLLCLAGCAIVAFLSRIGQRGQRKGPPSVSSGDSMDI
ncbi:MAG: hypothetical protein PHE36_04755 [Novosphingobium sp.]|nr:hypothetical protein [Novosphingobium sp.]